MKFPISWVVILEIIASYYIVDNDCLYFYRDDKPNATATFAKGTWLFVADVTKEKKSK